MTRHVITLDATAATSRFCYVTRAVLTVAKLRIGGMGISAFHTATSDNRGPSMFITSWRRLWVVCMMTASCAAAGSALAASPFDGTYKGSSPTVGSVSSDCKDYNLTIVVKDGHFNSNVLSEPFAVDIGADGAFSATALRPGGKGGMGYMTGKISGDTLDVSYHAADCAHHAVLKRS